MDAPKRIWVNPVTTDRGAFEEGEWYDGRGATLMATSEYILAAEHARLVAEKDAEIEEAFARGVNWAQEKAKVEGRLVIVDSPELVNLRTEIARLESEAEKRNEQIADMLEASGQLCACGYDYPSDVCLGHLSHFRKSVAAARNAALEDAARAAEPIIQKWVDFEPPYDGSLDDAIDLIQGLPAAIRAMKG